MTTNEYIIRVESDELTQKLLESKEEIGELSPLELYDNKPECPEDPFNEEPKILPIIIENDFEKQKKIGKLKDTTLTKGNEKRNGKSNTTGLDRN
jgi:hypothetical protein